MYDPKAYPHTVINGPRSDGSFCLTYDQAAWEARYPGHTLADFIAHLVQHGAREVYTCQEE